MYLFHSAAITKAIPHGIGQLSQYRDVVNGADGTNCLRLDWGIMIKRSAAVGVHKGSDNLWQMRLISYREWCFMKLTYILQYYIDFYYRQVGLIVVDVVILSRSEPLCDSFGENVTCLILPVLNWKKAASKRLFFLSNPIIDHWPSNAWIRMY